VSAPGGPQSGPGYIATTHGPVRREQPPWDYPAGADYPAAPAVHPDGPGPGPRTAVDMLDAEIAHLEAAVTGLRDLRVRLVVQERRRTT
jgi:hypothetical protein